ncbi:multicopper oxidase family protein [Aneurinibacillus thermoaerophilus]|uniref:Multicopper oxidase with three cupredoxin domains (Includes cell division protein FtsP and spore coat protein CotA) n=1 Tax=Aneurinibacillus thermoaerophilus TaxID=143495 RepID=A0A1G8BM27_ANETH|nr:multicopper oxidase family protein [Aneurinibacillus thermoaerophilus]MED0676062.1 multicopper oxidase family protein [Aneurinibacillus thermoaerophilus]MED0736346.1 multicopper oxidase family protein [Aneurinibacillus thermoaerophilus]SDH34231.1 Multicopper oxidase with three cupredoxin domains (includes cell division protein FtsP and spore coat protein CotA) [Aneurinibacillus thermoaerophilus]
MKKTLLFAGIATGAFLLTACGQMEKNSATEPPVKAENKETKQSATQIANQANRVIVDLVAKESRQEMKPGITLPVWTYGGKVPGQEIRVKQGQEVVVNLKNELSENVTIHWHGYPVPFEMDGVPGMSQNSIKPGESFTYKFTATVPGTYWYHSHKNSAEQVDRGLYGAFIVEKKDELKTDKDYTLILDEWETAAANQKSSKQGMDHSNMNIDSMSGQNNSNGNNQWMHGMDHSKMGTMNMSDNMKNSKGQSMHMMDHMASYDLFTVNGKSSSFIEPLVAKTGEVVRLRFINAGYQLRLMDFGNVPYRIVTTDGQDIQQPLEVKGKLLPIGPGERYDVVLTIPSSSFEILDRTKRPAAKDVKIMVQNQDNKSVAQTGKVTTELLDITTYGKATAKTERRKYDKEFKMVFEDVMDHSSDMGMKYTINGKSFPDTEKLIVKKGEYVKVTYENKGQANHPMHLHGHFVRVLSKNGKPVSGSPLIKDTLNVKPGETYEVEFVADNPGNWMFHCHDLHHASTGMMTTVEYEGYKNPVKVDRNDLSE